MLAGKCKRFSNEKCLTLKDRVRKREREREKTTKSSSESQQIYLVLKNYTCLH